MSLYSHSGCSHCHPSPHLIDSLSPFGQIETVISGVGGEDLTLPQRWQRDFWCGGLAQCTLRRGLPHFSLTWFHTRAYRAVASWTGWWWLSQWKNYIFKLTHWRSGFSAMAPLPQMLRVATLRENLLFWGDHDHCSLPTHASCTYKFICLKDSSNVLVILFSVEPTWPPYLFIYQLPLIYLQTSGQMLVT